MKKNQNEFEVTLSIHVAVVDFSETDKERQIFLKNLRQRVEKTIRDALSNPCRTDEGITSVRASQAV